MRLTLLLVFVLCISLLGCINMQTNTEIEFSVKTTDKEDLEFFEDGIIPWISIANPELALPNLIDKDAIVIKASSAIVLIDYPLNKPVEIEIKANNTKGFTRGELIRAISKEYKRIYAEEEQSAKVKTIPIEKREGLINRNATDGKYGIWGHDIGDLDLSAIYVSGKKDKPKLELFVES